MDLSVIIPSILSAAASGGLVFFLTARNQKVEADHDTIAKIKAAHEADVIQWTERLKGFFDTVNELHEHIEQLQEEITSLRQLLISNGIVIPPRPLRPENK